MRTKSLNSIREWGVGAFFKNVKNLDLEKSEQSNGLIEIFSKILKGFFLFNERSGRASCDLKFDRPYFEPQTRNVCQ